MAREFPTGANAFFAHAGVIAALNQATGWTLSVFAYIHDNNVRPFFARYSPGFIFQYAGGTALNLYNAAWLGGPAGIANNAFNHYAAIANGGSSQIRINGGGYVTGDTGGGATGGTFKIGGRGDGYQMYGFMCEAAMWNAVLTDSEIRALSRRVSPAVVRPTALVGYWPLWGNGVPEIDCSRTRIPIPSAGGTVPNKAYAHFAGSPMAL